MLLLFLLLLKLERLLLLFIICKKCRIGEVLCNVSRSEEGGRFQHSENNNRQCWILDLFVLSFFMLELVSKMLQLSFCSLHQKTKCQRLCDKCACIIGLWVKKMLDEI
jgi:hypothetical protein